MLDNHYYAKLSRAYVMGTGWITDTLIFNTLRTVSKMKTT